MVDLLFMMALGFLGSFGHCVGMCGPLTVALGLSQQGQEQGREPGSRWQQVQFHGLLNLGRLISYTLVGLGIGAIGSVLLASGQMAGIGSELRRLVAIFTGILLVWLGLHQIRPGLVPALPLLHPILQGKLHDRLQTALAQVSQQHQWWTPALLGLVWGLIPCGFLYTAQIKAAETGSLWGGATTMAAFGIGTLPLMLGVGVSAGMVSRDRRSQLHRLGGWITLIVGIMTLLRTGDTMVDFTGHGALIGLMLALIARPVHRVMPGLLRFRRALGVGAFVLALAHTVHMLEHTWGWNVRAIAFMLPQHQGGMVAGGLALVLMLPAALTSFDKAQFTLGPLWRRIHLLAVPALLLCAIHCTLVGSNYWGKPHLSWVNGIHMGLLSGAVVGVLLLRSPWFWSWMGWKEKYGLPHSK